MNYKDIQKKYEDAGILNYKLRNAEDLQNILGITLEDAKYFDKLAPEYKNMTIDFLLSFLNGCGLEYREGYKITKAYICQTQELLTETDADSYRNVVGRMDLNLTNPNNITIEYLRVPESYNEIKDSLTWTIETCNDNNTFLRIELEKEDGKEVSKEWFHVYKKNNAVEFY